MEKKQQDQTQQQPRSTPIRDDQSQNRSERSSDVRENQSQRSQPTDSTRQAQSTDRKY